MRGRGKMADIDVDVNALRADLARLESARADFEGRSSAFLSGISGSLDGMRSDFADQIRKTMRSMGDTITPRLSQRVNEYTDELRFFARSFEQADSEIGKSMQGVD